MSFQTVIGGNNGRGQGGYNQGGYNQGGYGGYQGLQQPAPQYSNQPAPYSTTGASSPSYGSEFAHTHLQDSDPYTAEKAKVALDIEQISLNYHHIHEFTSQINTPKDTVELRNALKQKIEESNIIGRRISSSFRTLNSLINGNVQERREKKQHVDKLDATFTRFYTTKFAEEVKTAEELMRRYTPRTAPAFDTPQSGYQYYSESHNEEDERAGLIAAQRQQEFMQLTNDVEIQSAQIRDRDIAIRALQREMSEVHDVFKDLASLVSEQGEMVNDIESNIMTAEQNVVAAHSEVNKAANYQKKGRNKLCIAAIVITILAAIIVLIVVLVRFLKK